MRPFLFVRYLWLITFIKKNIKMEKIKMIVNSTWFRAALAGGVGLALLLKGDMLYSGIAFGIGIREFLLAFKK